MRHLSIAQIILSATLSLAERERLFITVSFGLAVIGFFVITSISFFFPHTQTGSSFGQMQSVSRYLNAFFTILSSSE